MVATVQPDRLGGAADAENVLAGVRLRDVLRTLPKEVFQKNRVKAWLGVVASVTAVIAGYGLIVLSPWYLLPLAWIFTGTALTGWFVIGHDCGHRSFANRRWLNDLVGHLIFLPLLYPFHGWRILHDKHHKHTNKLGYDNAWEPFVAEALVTRPGIVQWAYQRLRGRFWWLASIAHWSMLHFDWRPFTGKARADIRFSALLVLVAAAVGLPTLVLTLGWWGLVKFWLMPWLVYHFWMSTFTLVHHTAPDIPFYPEETWHEVRSQLSGTVHCDYPGWVEFLCHNINVHIPHHISTAIPSYNLRAAHRALQTHWGQHLKERQFSWALMKEITDRCHIYDGEVAYRSFAEMDAQRS